MTHDRAYRIFRTLAVALVAHAAPLRMSHAQAQDLPGPSAQGIHADAFAQAADASTVRYRNMALILGHSVAIGWYGKTHWWKDGFTGDFRSVNEGWFGQHTYAGGADKLGHFYMNYAGTRLFARAFASAGNTPEQALVLAATMILGTMSAVEVVDAYSKRWRFSKEDAVVNALGAGTAILFEKYPALDRLVDLRFHYRRSAAGGDSFDPFGDFSGQTYVVALKASGVDALRERGLLRYLEFGLGYATRNYEDKRPVAGRPARRVYAGVSLNLSELLGRTAFKEVPPQRRIRRLSDTALEYIQVPGTAVFVRHTLPQD